MEDILRTAIASGLKFPISQANDISIIPDNTFGVFVGIERSKAHELAEWPINVHGCIGYWDPAYQNMDKKMILEKIITVAYDATWIDRRRKYFQHSIYVDLYAKYKIYFMLSPIKKINSETGLIEGTSELFNNKKYGLIVENITNQSQRATYLPDVFPDEDWAYIKKSLVGKASITDNSNTIFYAYSCDIYSMTLADYFINPIQQFINTNYKTFIPYTISNNIITIDKTEDVRNLAIIYDILQLKTHGYDLSSEVINAIVDNINYYKLKYKSRKQTMRQSSPFLMLDTYMTNKNDPYVDIIKKDLFEQLELQNKIDNGEIIDNFIPIDKNFELGEILMALIIVYPNNPQAKRELDKISKSKSDNNIFRYNWYSKLVKHMPDRNYKYNLIKNIIKYINNAPVVQETNYYAVEFEALATLYASISNQHIKITIEPYIERLIINLEQRRNKNGLYEFTDGTIRLDITGHVLNGFYALMSLA